PLSGGKQTFDLNVRFSANYVRFSPKSGRIDTVTMESARDPKRTRPTLTRLKFGLPRRQVFDPADNSTGCPCGVFK
ncbi:MAG: hypothetical protein O7G83_05585, partial [Proteobacteria bacterium]|nr:hypothetical protein [Pseudomonadota bacterium]